MSKNGYKIDVSWSQLYRYSMLHGLEYCRLCFSNENLTFDHIIPRAFNGTNTIDNITILCASCNNAKGTNYMSNLTSLAKVSPMGWTKKPMQYLTLGDFILAGTVVNMKTYVATRKLAIECEGAPWPNRAGGKGIDTSLPYCWVFVGAHSRELVNA
jgi:hypothetical protein